MLKCVDGAGLCISARTICVDKDTLEHLSAKLEGLQRLEIIAGTTIYSC